MRLLVAPICPHAAPHVVLPYKEFHELDGRGSHRRWRSGEQKVLAAGVGRRQDVDHGDRSTEGEADLLKLRHGVEVAVLAVVAS